MTIEKAYKELKEIFSKPTLFSSELNEGESYILRDNGHNSFIVSKKWGYWSIVVSTLQQYFKENGNIKGGGVMPSNNDIIGTVVDFLTEEEILARVDGKPFVEMRDGKETTYIPKQ